MAEKVIFFTRQYHHLDLVVKPSYYAEDEFGLRKKHPAIRVSFVPNASGVGEYRTEDPKIIHFLKEHSYFKAGEVFIAGAQNASPAKPAEKVKVKQGAAGSEESSPKAPEPPAPEDQPPAGPAAQVPKRRGGRRKVAA